MEELLYKFIDEGKHEQEEMRAFIHEFKTTNELLFKERNNSLSELKFEVQGLLRVINNTSISNLEVKGVTTRGGKTTTQDVYDNDTNIQTKEPLVMNHDKPVESNKDLTKDQPQKTNKPVVRPSSEVQTPPIPFPRRLRKEKKRLNRKRGQFLAIARAMIDVFNKKIMLRVGDDEVIFDMDQSIKRPPTEDDECYGVWTKLIDQLDLESCESFECKAVDDSDSGELVRRIKTVNTPEEMLLLQVLEKYKGAIAWKMSDIKGISPSYCTHKILMEDDYKPVTQPQRRLNPKVQDVVKNEIVKLLDSGLIYPISNSSWVSHIHVVPKTGGMTIVLNDNYELILSHTVTGWQDSSKFRLHTNQEKTTFTCPYGTFDYRRMSFGLCNAPATFQRCMTIIFHDMVEDFMEVFMDDFLIFDNSFDCCLANLDRMHARFIMEYLEDMAYPCLHSPKTMKETRSDTPYPEEGNTPYSRASGLRPYHFTYPERRLTMEEMLYKFINEGKREQEEMRSFIHEFKTTNELLFKERNNSLRELRFEVQGLLRVINNTPISNLEVKGVITRGGKTMTQDIQDNDTNIQTKELIVMNHDKPVESNEDLTKDQPQKTNEPVVQPSSKVQTPPNPFPRRLRKEKEEAQQKKLLENLKQLHINLPFIEALAQIPKYTKNLKGLLPNRARLEEACTITMNERCSVVLLNKLPLKEKDLGSFTIPCDIGQLHINNALADLGASISLMPYTMYEKLGLGEPKATRMSLELADRSIQYPRGIVENLLIKVDKFVLPIDFVILDMPEDSRVPIVLGRPFLSTARAMIDVFNKKITLIVGDDEVIFDMDQSIKRPPAEDDEC
ncbi:reverse transcriptase domain-containing protein [Tanacetum coccineum]